LENKITPTARAAAIKRNHQLKASIWEYLEKNDVPSNIADLIRWLRDQGFKIAQDNTERDDQDMTARKVRQILQDKLAIEGKMGRKLKVF
jgi:hypothetical protein